MEMQELTPKKIVSELDRYIIGQDKAKRAVAVSLRNRYRRSLLTAAQREEMTPKNIIMMGPTGVGKTEIARRISKLVSAPFIKVEATKFTEVGYVGRDVESMIRDLVTTSVRKVQQEKMTEVMEEAEKKANALILDLLMPGKKKKEKLANPFELLMRGGAKAETTAPKTEEAAELDRQKEAEEAKTKAELREQLKNELAAGKLEEREVEIEVEDNKGRSIGIMAGMSDDMNINLNDIMGDFMPKKKKKRVVKVKDARRLLSNQEAQKMIDMDEVEEKGLRQAEQTGIIFIDEIDKIIGSSGASSGPDVSREGVQRDILPIVEGCTVTTKYGPVKTDFILFIGAGAFHVSKVEDMIPELQGRFPVSVELSSLTEKDFIQILTQPENSAIKQYQELLATENVHLTFDEEAIKLIAKIAFSKNQDDEDIGARRLHTVLEKLLEEISFYASDYDQDTFKIDSKYVESVFNVKETEKQYTKFML